MRLRERSFWAAPPAMLAALGCDPHLPAAAGSGAETLLDGGGEGGGAGAGLVVVAEPSAPLSGVPRVLRLHASDPGVSLDPGRMALLKGVLGPRQLVEVVDGTLSATLAKQVVPTLSWRESESEGEALAPEAPLEAGVLYTLVVGDASLGVELTVAKTDPVPFLPRVWPPAGGSGTAGLGVWCGEAGLKVPPVDVAVVLEPGTLAGRIQKGAVGGGAGPSCLRFVADPGGSDAVGPVSPPPSVAAAGDPSAMLLLDPRPLVVDGPVAPVVPVGCGAGEVSFGPGCVRVADDRLYGRSGAAPLLWAVTGSGTDTVVETAPGDPFVVTGLPPASDVAMEVTTVDAAGRLSVSIFLAATLPPEPHVVINEVLAWPLGPSPAQEWVEIVNDGPAKAELGGYALIVGSGTTTLPAATLAPGAFALIVDAAYAPADGTDVPPAPGTQILSVPHLGKEGLSHAGVALYLIDGDGKTVSSFPAKPKPQQGKSVARVVPSAPDALASSFAPATPSPGRTNAF